MKRYFPYLYDKDDDGNEEYSVVVEENSTGKYCLYEDYRNEKAKDSLLLDANVGIIITLKAEIDALKETLAFYADPETYFAIGFFPDPPCGEFMEDFSDTGVELGFRAGKRARVALNIEIEQPKEQE